MDAVALETHYTVDPTRKGTLWAPDPADAHDWTAITAPCLLAVPLVLFRAIREEQKPLMSHKVRGLVLTIINDVDNFDKASNDW